MHTLRRILKRHSNAHHTFYNSFTSTRFQMHGNSQENARFGNLRLACITICVSERMVPAIKNPTLCRAFQKRAAMCVTSLLPFIVFSFTCFQMHSNQQKENTCFVMCLENKRQPICFTIRSHLRISKCTAMHKKMHCVLALPFICICVFFQKMHTMPCFSKTCGNARCACVSFCLHPLISECIATRKKMYTYPCA